MDNRKYNEKDVTASLDGIAEAIKSGGLAPSVIADPYSNEATYSVGDYVTFNAKSYRCITAIDTPEEFDSEKWDEIKVLDELASAVELPPVTSTDNGKILKVAEGVWAKGDVPTELPAVTSDDNDKILTVVEGVWNKGGYGPLKVTITQSTSNPSQYVADKTFAQVMTYIKAGAYVYAYLVPSPGNTFWKEKSYIPLSHYDDKSYKATFMASKIDNSYIHYLQIEYASNSNPTITKKKMSVSSDDQ